MYKRISKKGLNLAIAMVFAISNIVQAAPYSVPDTSHLRPAAIANTQLKHDIEDAIKSFPANSPLNNNSPAFAFENMPEGKFTLKQYSQKTGIPLSTTRRDFDVLEELGLVTIHRRSGGKSNEIESKVPENFKQPVLEILRSYRNKRDLPRIKAEISKIKSGSFNDDFIKKGKKNSFAKSIEETIEKFNHQKSWFEGLNHNLQLASGKDVVGLVEINSALEITESQKLIRCLLSLGYEVFRVEIKKSPLLEPIYMVSRGGSKWSDGYRLLEIEIRNWKACIWKDRLVNGKELVNIYNNLLVDYSRITKIFERHFKYPRLTSQQIIFFDKIRHQTHKQAVILGYILGKTTDQVHFEVDSSSGNLGEFGLPGIAMKRLKQKTIEVFLPSWSIYFEEENSETWYAADELKEAYRRIKEILEKEFGVELTETQDLTYHKYWSLTTYHQSFVINVKSISSVIGILKSFYSKDWSMAYIIYSFRNKLEEMNKFSLKEQIDVLLKSINEMKEKFNFEDSDENLQQIFKKTILLGHRTPLGPCKIDLNKVQAQVKGLLKEENKDHIQIQVLSILLNTINNIMSHNTIDVTGNKKYREKGGHPAFAFEHIPEGPFTLREYYEKTGVPLSTARRDFDVLERLGLVKIDRPGRGRTNIYTSNLPEELSKSDISNILAEYRDVGDVPNIAKRIKAALIEGMRFHQAASENDDVDDIYEEDEDIDDIPYEIEYLIDVIKGHKTYPRHEVKSVAEKLADIGATYELREALGDKDPYVREISTKILGEIGLKIDSVSVLETVVSAMIKALADPERLVRHAAEDSLVNIGERAVPFLARSHASNADVIRKIITDKKVLQFLEDLSYTTSSIFESSSLSKIFTIIFHGKKAKYSIILVKRSKSRVTIVKGQKKADASSLEQLAKLAAEEGDTVVIEAKGEDAMDVAMKIEEALKDESILGNIGSGIKSFPISQETMAKPVTLIENQHNALMQLGFSA